MTAACSRSTRRRRLSLGTCLGILCSSRCSKTWDLVGNFGCLTGFADIGHVQLAVHKDTKEKVAVKSMRKDLMKPDEIERARREIEIMLQLTKLNNPYIIKLIDSEE